MTRNLPQQYLAAFLTASTTDGATVGDGVDPRDLPLICEALSLARVVLARTGADARFYLGEVSDARDRLTAVLDARLSQAREAARKDDEAFVRVMESVIGHRLHDAVAAHRVMTDQLNAAPEVKS